jgi:hypothetical protein
MYAEIIIDIIIYLVYFLWFSLFRYFQLKWKLSIKNTLTISFLDVLVFFNPIFSFLDFLWIKHVNPDLSLLSYYISYLFLLNKYLKSKNIFRSWNDIFWYIFTIFIIFAIIFEIPMKFLLNKYFN